VCRRCPKASQNTIVTHFRVSFRRANSSFTRLGVVLFGVLFFFFFLPNSDLFILRGGARPTRDCSKQSALAPALTELQ
uniref:Uncharacterized protein n=1 Tax=Anopheles minimus TaxID=112268 RepID=A0A182VUV5_9DIPT